MKIGEDRDRWRAAMLRTCGYSSSCETHPEGLHVAGDVMMLSVTPLWVGW